MSKIVSGKPIIEIQTLEIPTAWYNILCVNYDLLYVLITINETKVYYLWLNSANYQGSAI